MLVTRVRLPACAWHILIQCHGFSFLQNTRASSAPGLDTQPQSLPFVFVSTFDCNTWTYCYCIGEDACARRLADTRRYLRCKPDVCVRGSFLAARVPLVGRTLAFLCAVAGLRLWVCQVHHSVCFITHQSCAFHSKLP